jgi:hypothetical protein
LPGNQIVGTVISIRLKRFSRFAQIPQISDADFTDLNPFNLRLNPFNLREKNLENPENLVKIVVQTKVQTKEQKDKTENIQLIKHR